MSSPSVLCLDIGGSSVKSAIFDLETFRESKELTRSFPKVDLEGMEFADVEAAVVKAVRAALAEVDTASIGISTTGSVAPDGTVLSAGHFDGYENISWRQILDKHVDGLRQVTVVNDGKASAWAEFSYFDTSKLSHVHFVLGTGVGSSVVVNGQLIDGDSGEAGFLGHTRVTNSETIVCSCDREGCIETVASAPGLVHQHNSLVGAEAVSDFAGYLDALRGGDEAAVAALDAACEHFGRLSATLANALNPRHITFGGGVIVGVREALESSGAEDFLGRVRNSVDHTAFYRSAASTDLRYGAYENDGGLIGAALRAVEA